MLAVSYIATHPDEVATCIHEIKTYFVNTKKPDAPDSGSGTAQFIEITVLATESVPATPTTPSPWANAPAGPSRVLHNLEPLVLPTGFESTTTSGSVTPTASTPVSASFNPVETINSKGKAPVRFTQSDVEHYFHIETEVPNLYNPVAEGTTNLYSGPSSKYGGIMYSARHADRIFKR
jgi:hypothetical protein